jgi:hypothetical protein
MCSGPEAGSYFRLIDCVHQPTLGLRVIKKRRGRRSGLICGAASIIPANSAAPASLSNQVVQQLFNHVFTIEFTIHSNLHNLMKCSQFNQVFIIQTFQALFCTRWVVHGWRRSTRSSTCGPWSGGRSTSGSAASNGDAPTSPGALSICLYFYLSICLSVYQYCFLSILMSVYLSIYLSI